MISFLICLALLVIGYLTYGKVVDIFSPAPAPRTLHPGTSFARWTSSTVLCPLAAVHFALRSRQTLCPFENNLFHRTYLCRSRLAEAEGRSFFCGALPPSRRGFLRRAPRVRRVFL